jgi:hypothetical protein
MLVNTFYYLKLFTDKQLILVRIKTKQKCATSTLSDVQKEKMKASGRSKPFDPTVKLMQHPDCFCACGVYVKGKGITWSCDALSVLL